MQIYCDEPKTIGPKFTRLILKFYLHEIYDFTFKTTVTTETVTNRIDTQTKAKLRWVHGLQPIISFSAKVTRKFQVGSCVLF